ncbi:MAG: Rrf2 family transcriptional regulator [bacterium]|nr:Rrf2 family transcriptional regulator [bacterium]
MKLTSRSEYALLALVFLARQPADGFVRVEEIASAQGIPPKFLEQILLALKRGHYLASQKGQHGGYRLNQPPDRIILADVIRLLDGPLAPTESVSKYFYRSTPIEKEPALVHLFTQIRDCMLHILEGTTLADIQSPPGEGRPPQEGQPLQDAPAPVDPPDAHP